MSAALAATPAAAGCLDRWSALGIAWGHLLGEAGPLLRPGIDPWRVHPIDLRAGVLPPSLPDGPAVYGALGWGCWQYAGQTVTEMVSRLRGHRCDGNAARREAKHSQWAYVAVLPLVDTATPADIGRLERAAQQFLRPRMGSRWARAR